LPQATRRLSPLLEKSDSRGIGQLLKSKRRKNFLQVDRGIFYEKGSSVNDKILSSFHGKGSTLRSSTPHDTMRKGTISPFSKIPTMIRDIRVSSKEVENDP
jgi:hypothetical protein